MTWTVESCTQNDSQGYTPCDAQGHECTIDVEEPRHVATRPRHDQVTESNLMTEMMPQTAAPCLEGI